MSASPETIRKFLSLLSKQELEAIKARIAAAIVKNERYTSLSEGGQSAAKSELVPTADLMDALANELKRRSPEEYGRPQRSTVRYRF